MLDMEGLREFAQLENEIADLDAKVNKLKKRKNDIGPALVENLADEKIDKITILGRTIHPHVRIVSQVKSKRDAIEALKEAGFQSYIDEGYNTTSLNALLAEMTRNGEKLPEAFEGRISINSVITLRSKTS